MALGAGSQLGPYEIVALIGAGGMGEVYRARDPRVGREVAIKVSTETFSERFDREARVIASLNHPNICTLFDVGPNYLVMELVEGEAPHGPLPLEETLGIVRQIASALEAAHEKGITHRDLKPGNIKVKPDGTVKVLDFGLAKITPAEAGATPEDSSTLSMAGTQAGMILGTAPYMAPEQARGYPVDKRADIWAFGVVFHELLTGKRLFTGETVTDILAAVVTSEPDLERVPPNVRRLLRTCLEKDPRKRLRDIGDAWRLMEDAPAPPRQRRTAVPWLVAAVALLALAAVLWNGLRTSAESRWSGEWLGGSTVAFDPSISPDGQTLGFEAMVDSLTQVAVMKPESGNWQVLTHDRTRGFATEVSWSRDGTKLYFTRFQDVPRGIYSIPVLGGEERLVLEDAGGAHALPDGSLVVVRLNAARQRQLQRFWPETGRLQPLKGLVGGGIDTASVRVTPAGDQVVFFGTPIDQPDAPNHLYAMDLSSEKTVTLAPGVSMAESFSVALAIAADGKSVLLSVPAGDANRIVSARLDGSPEVRMLLTLTSSGIMLDVAPDGSLYTALADRTGEVLRLSPNGGAVEHVAQSPDLGARALVLPLPDGRILFISAKANRTRLLVAGAGKEPSLFVDTQDQTAGPAAMVGQTQTAFMIGEGANRTIGLASIADGRLARRLNGPKGADIGSIVASPDGSTIYYTASGSVWSIPVSDGTPKKLRSGDSVTIDPYKNDLIVKLAEKEDVRLVREPLAGGPERPIPVQAGLHPTADPLHPNAVGRDGRILLSMTLPTSWFWAAGLLDPQTGRVEMLKIGYDADIPSGGWTPDGKIALVAFPMRSSLWRFRMEGNK